MKSLLICFSLLAAASLCSAQKSLVVSNGGQVVTASSGDITCVISKFQALDPVFIVCFAGSKETLNEKVQVAEGHTVSGNDTTSSGNFISWILTHPGPGTFVWEIDVDGDVHTGAF